MTSPTPPLTGPLLPLPRWWWQISEPIVCSGQVTAARRIVSSSIIVAVVVVVVARLARQQLAKQMPVPLLYPPMTCAGLDVIQQGEDGAQVWHQLIKGVPPQLPMVAIIVIFVLVIIALSEEIISSSMLL
jgi:hypothetical protein